MPNDDDLTTAELKTLHPDDIANLKIEVSGLTHFDRNDRATIFNSAPTDVGAIDDVIDLLTTWRDKLRGS